LNPENACYPLQGQRVEVFFQTEKASWTNIKRESSDLLGEIKANLQKPLTSVRQQKAKNSMDKRSEILVIIRIIRDSFVLEKFF
jgi:hypothetical protein